MADVQAVIWDVGGTMVTRAYSYEESRLHALGRTGIDPADVSADALERAFRYFAERLATWRTLSQERREVQEIARMMLAGTDTGEEDIHRLGTELHHYFDSYTPVPGVPELVAELAGAGIRQGVISNWPPSLRPFLRHHGLYDYFDTVTVSGEEGIEKPDTRLFQRALQRMELEARQAVYVGNSMTADIAPARELGIHAVHFRPGQEDHQGLRDAGALRRVLFSLVDAST